MLTLEFPKNVGDNSKGKVEKRDLTEEVKAVERVISPRCDLSETMTRKLAQTNVKLEQKRKKILAQHDFKSSQMIQIWDGYATFLCCKPWFRISLLLIRRENFDETQATSIVTISM